MARLVFGMNVLLYAGLIVDGGFDSLGPVEVARGRIPIPTLVRTIVGIRAALRGCRERVRAAVPS